jgi:membrane peptidoglycan carboxypeptidase
MVPSLASAIGSSGDRPLALAELVGIILNDGVKNPLVRLDELHFAAGTPYETKLGRVDNQPGERVLKSEVAQALKGAMRDVVESGTARRVFKAFSRSDGKAYVIGGKTGTGDHRHEVYGPGGHLIASRVVNRTATFAFYLGDRFFGVISAHVPGAEAAKFDFTSALAAELLKVLSSSLEPMIERSGAALSPFAEDNAKEKGKSAQPTPAPATQVNPQAVPSQPPVVSSPAPQPSLQAPPVVASPVPATLAPTTSTETASNQPAPEAANPSLEQATEPREGTPTPAAVKKRRKPSQSKQSLPIVLPPPT